MATPGTMVSTLLFVQRAPAPAVPAKIATSRSNRSGLVLDKISVVALGAATRRWRARHGHGQDHAEPYLRGGLAQHGRVPCYKPEAVAKDGPHERGNEHGADDDRDAVGERPQSAMRLARVKSRKYPAVISIPRRPAWQPRGDSPRRASRSHSSRKSSPEPSFHHRRPSAVRPRQRLVSWIDVGARSNRSCADPS